MIEGKGKKGELAWDTGTWLEKESEEVMKWDFSFMIFFRLVFLSTNKIDFYEISRENFRARSAS